jgi:pimeloyl-ACP methyl ester carboxylesterase
MIHATTSTTTSTDLHVETWGDGTPVVLVHGSLATGAEEWAEQRPLAERGHRLVVPDRRGYGASPAAVGEDYLVDADDIGRLLGDGAHLVGHSYGGLGALVAAARRPEAVLSLTLLEPAVAEAAPHDRDWQGMIEDVRVMWTSDLGDRDWVVGFLKAVGSDPAGLPPEFLDAAVATVPVFRNGRFFAEADVPFDAVRNGRFPKLVVSGGHHPGFEAMSRDLADRIGASHIVVEGAGHEIQFTGRPLNDALAAFWAG